MVKSTELYAGWVSVPLSFAPPPPPTTTLVTGPVGNTKAVFRANNVSDITFALITARIRSMTGRYCFHRCLSVNISGGGTPSRSGWYGGGTPSQVWLGWYPIQGGTPLARPGMGYPLPPGPGMGYPPDMGWGTPPGPEMGYPPPRQISIASTCYMAGGMLLAFTQEDFLVLYFGFMFHRIFKSFTAPFAHG